MNRNMLTMNRTTTSIVSSLTPYCQNGGLENGSWNGKEGWTVKLADELDNYSDEVDNVSRQPASKNVNKSKLTLKNWPSVSSNEDGSLPSSPDSPSECMTLAEYKGGLGRDTQELLGHFFRIYTGLSPPGRSRSKALSTLKRVVSDVITKHQIAYNGMIQRLCLDERDDDMSFVATVAENLFSDGSTNWGRIVSLVAFGATVCQHLKEAGREGCVDQVGVQISSYLLNHKKDWLLSNNGWDGFVEVFHVEDPESVVRNALMAFAGVAGLGAGLAYLIR
ncbi:induced myeloid leukemia cell differentiation protein Mcl-1-like [Conger conger]|uniref:induced myeloid leukemia cell differentiation protein Mcl-1-like n=1 Tax=Conger conger TaxID=82655 RepID=UPI002A5AEB62|nr:induced myeloid leukemia cell differentiation protein Mcl-1-like [Conger conger]